VGGFFCLYWVVALFKGDIVSIDLWFLGLGMRSRRLRDRGSGLYQRVVRRRSVHGDALCQSCKVDVRSRSGVVIKIEMDRCCFVEDGIVWA
jgi:hypothetical protein